MRRSVRIYAAVGLVAILGMTKLGLAQTVTTVPDSAVVMIKVNNVQKVSQKVGKLCEQWGLAAMVPELSDPLGSLQGRLSVSKGINSAGELAVIILDQGAQPQMQRPFIILVPVTDYQAFIGNFQNPTVDGAITNVIIPGADEPAFVAQWGQHAALAMDKALLETPLKQSAFPAAAAGQMSQRDVVAYVNFRSFRDKAAGGLAAMKPFIIGQLDQAAAAQPAEKKKLVPLAKVALGQILAGVDHILKETQAGTYGLAIADDGIQITTLCEFEPDSYLAKTSAKLKNGSGTLVSGLPGGQYIAVGGVVLDSPVYSQLVDDAASPILAQVAKMGPEVKPIADYVTALKTILNATRRQSFCVSASDQKVGDGALFSSLAVIDGDAKAIQDSQKTIAASQDQFMKLLDFQGAGGTTTSFKPAAKTLGGVTFDQIVVAMNAPQGTPEAAMQKMIYGPNGMTGCVGQINPKTVLVSQLADDATILKGIEAAKSGSTAAIDDNIKLVSAKLPANRIAEGYLNLDHIASLVSKVLEATTGQPLPVEIPAGQPPIGVSVSSEGASVRTDVYIPSGVIQNIVGAVVQMQMGQMLNEKKEDGGL